MSIALAISAALVTGNIFPVGGTGVGVSVVGYYDFVAKKKREGIYEMHLSIAKHNR